MRKSRQLVPVVPVFKLVAGKIPAITSIDGSATDTLDEFKVTLLELISALAY
ncbi:MAG: hypothetical protein WAU56_11300 [Steroidobacteraceae bacterium]